MSLLWHRYHPQPYRRALGSELAAREDIGQLRADGEKRPPKARGPLRGRYGDRDTAYQGTRKSVGRLSGNQEIRHIQFQITNFKLQIAD